jgi:hypothetical protein
MKKDDWDVIAVMIGAFDTLRSGRKHLLFRTCRTARIAFPDSPIYVVDNGSEGEDAELAKRIAGHADCKARYRNVGVGEDGNRTPGRLANEKMRLVFEESPGPAGGLPFSVVLSDDDVWWKPHAGERLKKLWCGVHDNVYEESEKLVMVSGYLEPLWHWNAPSKVVRVLARNEVGPPERVLIRGNAPGTALSFPLWLGTDGPGVIARRWQDGFGERPFVDRAGYDHEMSVRCSERGLLVGQLDLADHTGWGFSNLKNSAISDATPLDRKAWGI